MKLFTKATLDEKEKLFIASDGVEDRQGEIINQDGWNLENYKKNPVVMWAHNYEEPPIGIAEKLGFRTIDGKKKLVYQPVFHRKTPMSNYIADLVDAGVLKASSVGFKPEEMNENEYTKLELLEISIVGVPANQGALQMAYSKGYDEKTVKKVFPDAVFEKAVIGYKKYPLSTANSWDGPTEMKDADTKDLKAMCAWYDSEKPEIKSSYKLPHHELSGYKTNWKGVVAAMAALMGARGGVDIPESDRQGVYLHLAKHYTDFDKEAPELKNADEIVDKFVEAKGADEKIIELTKTVNVFIDEVKQETEKRKEIAEKNTESFQKEIIKRFEDIEFNIAGLTEGISPSEKGLEQRLLDIETSVEQISKDIREYLTSQPVGKGVSGREPVNVGKKEVTHNTAIKVLNKCVEVLNKTK